MPVFLRMMVKVAECWKLSILVLGANDWQLSDGYFNFILIDCKPIVSSRQV